MKFLLDTTIFLWSLDSFENLNPPAQHVLESGEDVFLSAASSWEIVIQVGARKAQFAEGPEPTYS